MLLEDRLHDLHNLPVVESSLPGTNHGLFDKRAEFYQRRSGGRKAGRPPMLKKEVSGTLPTNTRGRGGLRPLASRSFPKFAEVRQGWGGSRQNPPGCRSPA